MQLLRSFRKKTFRQKKKEDEEDWIKVVAHSELMGNDESDYLYILTSFSIGKKADAQEKL